MNRLFLKLIGRVDKVELNRKLSSSGKEKNERKKRKTMQAQVLT